MRLNENVASSCEKLIQELRQVLLDIVSGDCRGCEPAEAAHRTQVASRSVQIEQRFDCILPLFLCSDFKGLSMSAKT
jgi:hypothetical protein